MIPPVSGIGGPQSAGYTPAARPAAPGGPSFADELRRSGSLRLSKHAAERVRRRGIGADPRTVKRLEKGVDLAARKGSRAAVVMVDDTAYVVAVPSRTVVTAVDQAHMRDQVFTNIDSAVIA